MQPLATGNTLKYPYFIVPEVEKYRALDPLSEEARKLSRFLAVNIGDYASLRLVLGIDPPDFAKFYPDMETPAPDTLDTIDSFLDKFGTKMPAAGYMADYEKEEASFKELIRQKRYGEALALIERQNLINPQKSIYFAHQMRFLKKLIAIENYRKQTEG